MTDVELIRTQKEELENLSNIYLSDLQIQRQAHPARFSILCHPFSEKSADQYKIRIHIQFSNQYPKKPLNLQVEALIGITSENVAALQRTARGVMAEAIGKPFVYDIVETTRRWIQNYLVEGQQQQEEQDENKGPTEVFERPKYATYTPVTVENFLIWKKAFQLEMFEAKRKKQAQLEERMSGKQYFMKNQVQESDEEDEETQVVQSYQKKESNIEQEKEESQEDILQDDEMWNPN